MSWGSFRINWDTVSIPITWISRSTFLSSSNYINNSFLNTISVSISNKSCWTRISGWWRCLFSVYAFSIWVCSISRTANLSNSKFSSFFCRNTISVSITEISIWTFQWYCIKKTISFTILMISYCTSNNCDWHWWRYTISLSIWCITSWAIWRSSWRINATT